MDLTLTRNKIGPEGAFSEITGTTNGIRLFVATEHAYQDQSGEWFAKIPEGEYQCLLGTHELAGGPVFETYQVMNVPGHSGILFHKGNLPETDSAGCILLGTSFGELNGVAADLNSAVAFKAFLILQQGQPFKLTVVNAASN